MPARRVTVLDRQSLVDIALQEHGSVEALFQVVADAGLGSITGAIAPGQLLEVKAAPLDVEPPAYYRRRGQYPVTGDVLPYTPFVCAGPELFALTAVSSFSLRVTTTTGWLTLRPPSGVLAVYGNGVPAADVADGGFVFDVAPGTYCAWASDASGEPSGETLFIGTFDDQQGVASLDTQYLGAIQEIELFGLDTLGALNLGAHANLRRLRVLSNVLSTVPLLGTSSLTTLQIDGELITGMDLSECSVLQSLTGAMPALTSIVPPPNQTLRQVTLIDCNLNEASVDGIVNACDPLYPFGGALVIYGGGTAAPGPGSATNLAAIGAASPLNVSGAGEALANGDYDEYFDVVNGRPAWEHPVHGSFLSWDTAKWVLSTTSGSYRSDDDVPYPWLGTWALFGASAPTPTINPPHQAWMILTN